MTPEFLIGNITLFVLAIFLGFELITKVPATLHTPLMSGANAISGISIIGALIGANVAYESGDTAVSGILAFVAVVLAMINVVGGSNLTLGEAEKCAQLIQGQISENARIIWGAAVDESLGEDIRVMLVLTGVRSEQIHGASENRQLRALKSRNIEFVN